MSQFTITGTAARITAQVTWTDGTLEGDVALIAEGEALARHDIEVGIPGVWAGPAGFDEHVQALATLAYLMDPGYVVDGDEPDVEQPPDPEPEQFDVVT